MKNLIPVFGALLAPIALLASERDDILAARGTAEVSMADIVAASNEVPEKDRYGTFNDPDRANNFLSTLLLYRQVANDAIESGLAEEQWVKDILRIEREKKLAQIQLDQYVANLEIPDWEALAKEVYIANPQDYLTPREVDVSHVLIRTSTRSPMEALAIAQKAKGELDDGTHSFEDLVDIYSEDQTKATNGGRIGWIRPGKTVQGFDKAAFDIQEAGDVTSPVQSQYGYHIIRLNEKKGGIPHSYNLVRIGIIRKLEADWIARQKEVYVDRFYGEQYQVNDGAIERVRERFGPQSVEQSASADSP